MFKNMFLDNQLYSWIHFRAAYFAICFGTTYIKYELYTKEYLKWKQFWMI